MYCDVCVPGVMVIGIVRGSPAPRSSTMCDPAANVSVSGVAPCSTLSMNTLAPGGLLAMVNPPVVGTVTGGAAKKRLAPYIPPAAITMSTAAAAAMRVHERDGLVESIAVQSSPSSAATASCEPSEPASGTTSSFLGSISSVAAVAGASSAKNTGLRSGTSAIGVVSDSTA